jgi:hypothetical protein
VLTALWLLLASASAVLLQLQLLLLAGLVLLLW